LDNLTHSLTGWALGQAGLKSKSRKGLAALILGANMPDIDVFFGKFPWDPLAIHRGFTHSFIGGAILMPPILAGLLLLLDRWQVSRGKTFRSGLPMRPWWLLALCYIGAISHPSLDVLTTYSVQLLSPFSNAWYHSDGLFIVDVWIWLLLAVSLAISQAKERAGRNWWRVPQVGLAIILAYIGVNIAISQRAWNEVRQWAGNRPADAIFASPPPLHFWRRELVWREGDCYRRGSYDPFAGFGKVSRCEPTHMDDPLVRRVISGSPRLKKFLKWSILPQAHIERSGCTATLSIGDARYGPPGRSRLSREIAVRTC
jgi:inner membrane protein